MPRDAAAALHKAAVDRIARRRGKIQQRHPRGPARIEQLTSMPLIRMRVDAARHQLELVARCARGSAAALAQHDVEVQVAGQPFVEPQRRNRRCARSREEIVRAHDLWCCARCCRRRASPSPARRRCDAVVLREIVGGRQPVAAAADDHRVVVGRGSGLRQSCGQCSWNETALRARVSADRRLTVI